MFDRQAVGIHRLDQISCGQQSEYLYQLSDPARETRVRVLRRRRKTMALYVEKGLLTELRVPTNCPWQEIHSFLQSRFDWIISAEEEMLNREVGPVDEFRAGGVISYLGDRIRLRVVKSRFSVVELDDHDLYVSCTNPGKPQLIEKLVISWLRRQAETVFADRLDSFHEVFDDGRQPGQLSVRKMRARWGSCSSQGEICLNLMLIREKMSQIDFVIAHELCHLRHFAHNEAFFTLLDQVMPDWREREQLLGKAG